MRNYRKLMGVLVLGYSGLAAAQTATTPPEDGTRLERITVTAERRVSVLDDTPAAITALDGSRLADQGVTKIEDIVMLAPNTNFTTGQGASQLFIRGIGNVFILAGGDPGVAMYTDGAYISDQYSSNLALFDTQRVEVLRGPQGALYGRNATGGAMNIISARPTAAWDSRAGLVFGNYNRREVEGHLSGPVGGGTSLRFSFQAKEADGYTKNPLAGQTGAPVVPGLAPTTGPDRLDDTSTRAFRLQSSTDFGAGNLRLIAGRYREDEAGPSSAVLIDPIMISQLLFNALPSTDPRVVKSHDSTLKVDVDTFQAIYEHTLGANTLSLTASWRKSKTFHRYDGDVTEGPAVATQFLTEGKDKMVDLHVASETGVPFQWLVGATALRFDQGQDVRVSAQVPLGFLVPGAPLNVPFPGGVDILLGGKVRTKSLSAYADVRYAFTPALALLAGVRANKDEKSADEYQDIAAFGLVGRGTLTDSWRSTPGSVGLEYRLSPETLTYGKVSTGFKSGAVNLGSLQSSMVKPERVTAEEIGLKTDFLERRGTFNVALFNSDYRDMQVSQVGTATVILTNAAKARIRGAEFELAFRPVAPLTLSATVGLMEPEYTDFVNADIRNAPTTFVNVKGNQLAQVSRQQYALGAEWVSTVGGLRLALGGDYVWRSKFFFTEFNTPDAVQDGYGLLNFAGSIRPAKGPWKVYGFVRNAADKTALTGLLIASPILGSGRQVTYTRPREYGIGATIDF